MVGPVKPPAETALRGKGEPDDRSNFGSLQMCVGVETFSDGSLVGGDTQDQQRPAAS